MSTINIQTMRYINLLDSTSRVKTRKCFVYNNTIIFAVPSELMSRAIGPNASNIHYLQEKLGKRIRQVDLLRHKSPRSDYTLDDRPAVKK